MSDDIDAKIAAQRANLEHTLDAIENKLNVPKQASRFADKAKVAYNENPVPWIVGATAVGISVIGIVAWALLSNDE
ncbi:hypothetical protein GCM10027413_03150 [Conyzicola nivalis]|uniref:DUF3618 domain-containing protein n=1 Tax=Conyzicola nivalis TaxID=1477021 RepID=A0A916SQ82_9MICO|nr:DUF3618 domain-containing protein [Conyzicola nivalis]GGB08275.1 hypothetical protein GCM10010979_23490 [Conyzicola nivalis]